MERWQNMGAMLIGMATGVVAMGFSAIFIGFLIVSKIIIALVIFADARRQKMEASRWAVTGLFLDFWIIPVYIIAKRKMTLLKCTVCHKQIERDASFCSSCGTPVKAFDDGAFLKKSLLCVVAILFGVIVTNAVFNTIITY